MDVTGGPAALRHRQSSSSSSGPKIRLNLQRPQQQRGQHGASGGGGQQWTPAGASSERSNARPARPRRRPTQQPSPPCPGMVLLTQLHGSDTPTDGSGMLQQAIRMMEQTPTSPLLSPLAMCLREQCASPAGAAALPGALPPPQLRLPAMASAAALGETPTAALLASLLSDVPEGDVAALEEMLQDSDFTLESLLSSLPCSPAVVGPAGGASLTPILGMPSSAGAAAASPAGPSAAAAASQARVAAAGAAALAASPVLVAMQQPGGASAAGGSLVFSSSGGYSSAAGQQGPYSVSKPGNPATEWQRYAMRSPLPPLLWGNPASPSEGLLSPDALVRLLNP